MTRRRFSKEFFIGILQELADGKLLKNAASERGIPYCNLKRYLNSFYIKEFGVNTSLTAVAAAMRQGLID